MQDLERRLERAKLHLDDLDIHVKQLGFPHSYATERSRDLKRGGYVLKVPEHEAVPPDLGFIAADFVHNLRALLDNIVWEIAPSHLKGNKNLAFPLCETRTAFDEINKSAFERRMPGKKVAALRRHQPYKRRPEDVRNDRLRLLHQMWNADKHHAPFGVIGNWAIAASAASYGDIPADPPFGFYVGPLRKNNEVGWVSPEGANRNYHPRVVLDIGFQTRRPTLTIPRHALLKMYDIVANEVLPDFGQFFK